MDRQRIIKKLAEAEFVVSERVCTVVRELGRGGNGVAFLCRSSAGEELVTKVYIPPDSRDLDEKAFKRFENEITLTSRLKHMNIVPSYGSSYVTVGAYKLPFYLMPVAEKTLRGEIRNDTDPHQIERKFRLFLRASYGVACLHSHGVVHRDLKPENILISKTGTAWIADLGIAHVNSDFVTVSIRTADDERLMNRDYYAPEQRFGQASAVDHRADIYALGCILYELLTSIPPVRASQPTLGTVSSALKPIEPIWERMTAWNPSDRYQQIEEALEDLSISFGLVLAMLRGAGGLEHPDVEVMSKLLRSNNNEHRQQALDLAARLGKAATPKLHSLIGHSKREVRNWCARALGAIGDPSSLRYLVAGLYNEFPQARRRDFSPYIDTAAEAIRRYPPDDRLRALEIIDRKIRFSEFDTILGDLKSAAIFDAVLVLRKKSLVEEEVSVLRKLLTIDEDRAWLEIAAELKARLHMTDSLVDLLNPERQAIVLEAWINEKDVYGFSFEKMVKAVAQSKLDVRSKDVLFNALEQKINSFDQEYSRRDEKLAFLMSKRTAQDADGEPDAFTE
jgi:serine/threonine protein kinase